MAKLTATKCPFLNKFSLSFLNNYSNVLMNNFLNKCPHMSKRLSSSDFNHPMDQPQRFQQQQMATNTDSATSDDHDPQVYDLQKYHSKPSMYQSNKNNN